MKARVNERFLYELSEMPHLEVIQQESSRFHIRRNAQLIEIELLGYDIRAKRFDLAINGYIFKVKLEDELDDVIRMISQKSINASDNQVINAPIPGLIKALIKANGDPVEQGEAVLVLEAMKMENTIQSPVVAVQIQYHVNKGDHVSKGQKLFTLFKANGAS